MSTPYKILIAGPQGSGKGTQAELLAKALGVPALSMGQLLRDEVAAGTDIGQEIKSILDKGLLVPEHLSATVAKARLAKSDVQNGYILDGYPRNVAQLGHFTFDVPTHMLVLEIPRDESLRRLMHRLTCNTCGNVYNALDGHLSDEACPCGGRLVKRKDDTAEAIERRLAIYEADTLPVIAHFAKKGIVVKVDGVGTVPDVAARVLAAIKM